MLGQRRREYHQEANIQITHRTLTRHPFATDDHVIAIRVDGAWTRLDDEYAAIQVCEHKAEPDQRIQEQNRLLEE